MIKWVKAEDCFPPHGLDLMCPHDYKKVNMLVREFQSNGFDKSKPALIGYPLDNKIQLLSGTHRHEAAKRTGIRLPVVLWLRSDINDSWGLLEKWLHIMNDFSVSELEKWTREDLESNKFKEV